jgi:hypothetical protein
MAFNITRLPVLIIYLVLGWMALSSLRKQT